jgi:protein PhnA
MKIYVEKETVLTRRRSCERQDSFCAFKGPACIVLFLEMIMASEPKCPACEGESTYADGNLWVCPMCAHEWSQSEVKTEEVAQDNLVRDSNGNVLNEGDTIVVIKDLKVKGMPTSIKVGTKAKNIKLRDMGDGHNISCRIEGFGDMNLKSEFVKKA